MADSDNQTVDLNDLDAFSDTFFGKSTPVVAEPTTNGVEETEEIKSEIETPSATEDGNESQDNQSNQEDAPASEDEEVEGDEEKDSLFKVKPRKSAKERIDELTAARREAERRADALARELEDERRARSVKEEKVQPRVDTSDGAPNPDETLEDGSPKYALGEFDPNYIRDLTRFTIGKEHEAIKKADAEEKTRQAQEDAKRQLSEHWTNKLTEAAEELPELSTKSVQLEDTFRGIEPNYGQYLAATIMSLDYGPYVLDYLADNIDEARKIVASGPTQATIALGRLEAKISFAKEQEQKRNEVEKGKVKTSAPPPPPRTRGSSTGNGVTGDTDDLDAFEKVFFAPKRR